MLLFYTKQICNKTGTSEDVPQTKGGFYEKKIN